MASVTTLARNCTPARLAAGLVVTLLATIQLGAQAKAPKPLDFAGDAGFVMTSGNTAVTTLTLNEKLVLNSGPWKLTQQFGVVYGKLKDSVNTSIWRTGLRGDRLFSDLAGVYLLVNFDKNRFAGVAGRWEQGAGALVKAIREDTDKLEFELGLSAIQQQAVSAVPDRTFASGRAAAIYKHFFAEKAYFTQTAEYLPNLQNGPDWRLNSESALVAPLSSSIGIKMAFSVRYQNLPDPGFLPADRLFSTGIQVTY